MSQTFQCSQHRLFQMYAAGVLFPVGTVWIQVCFLSCLFNLFSPTSYYIFIVFAHECSDVYHLILC